MNKLKLLISAACLTLILAVTTYAQIDIGWFYLYENGERVGEIYVEHRAEGQTHYIEHWVLYPNYKYPGPKFIGELRILPVLTAKPYSNADEFFRNVPFEKGSKYIKVTADEYDSLPVRR